MATAAGIAAARAPVADTATEGVAVARGKEEKKRKPHRHHRYHRYPCRMVEARAAAVKAEMLTSGNAVAAG